MQARSLRAAAILRSRGGPDAPDLAPIETNLAVVDREEGDFAAADEHLRRALELQAGSEHPHHAITLHDHALNLVSLGRVDEALEAFERAQAINAAVYGSGHELLAQRRMDLAEHLHEAGATALALPLARAARAQLPPDADPALREAIESWLAEVDQGYPGPGE